MDIIWHFSVLFYHCKGTVGWQLYGNMILGLTGHDKRYLSDKVFILYDRTNFWQACNNMIICWQYSIVFERIVRLINYDTTSLFYIIYFFWLIDLFHLLSDLYRYRSSHSEYTKVHRVCKAFHTSQFAKQPKHRLIKHKSIKCMSKSSFMLHNI